MKIVQVTYTAKAGFSQQNQLNIKNVMADLQHWLMQAFSIIPAWGRMAKHLFIRHFSVGRRPKLLASLASFKSFQEQLKASIPEVPPGRNY